MRFNQFFITLYLASAAISAMAADEPSLPTLPFQAVSEPTAAQANADETAPQADNSAVNSGSGMAQPTAVGTDPVDLVSVPKPEPKPQKRPVILNVKPEIKRVVKSDMPSQKSGVTIKTKPGITESVVIARDKLNRIVTPYANPKVLTVDRLETKIDGSSVYVATDMDTPASLFISDVDTGNATSLQLIPNALTMPVEVRIMADLPSGHDPGSAVPSSETAALFGQESDYLSEIKTILQTMAKQLIPSGFTLDGSVNEAGESSLCHSAGLQFTLGQTLVGQDAKIIVLIAHNTGFAPRLFEEAFCASEPVIAVAAWPKIRLNPGEKTEVFVLMRNDPVRDEEHRPSLL